MSTRSLNKAMLIGNLTRDPELRYTSGGTPVATFTVATNRNYTDSSGKTVETAEFTSVVAWAKLAEICAQLLKKGVKVYVEGRLQTSSWDDKETGKTMRRTELVVTDMIILSSNRGESVPDKTDSVDAAGSSPDMGEDVVVDASAFDVDFDEVVGSKNDKDKDADDNKDGDGDGGNDGKKDEEENDDNKEGGSEK